MNREGFEVIANSAAFRSLTLTHARDRQDRFCSVWMKQNSAQGNTLTTTAYLCLGKQKTSVSRPRLTTCILFRAQPLSLTAPSLRIFYRTSDTTLPQHLFSNMRPSGITAESQIQGICIWDLEDENWERWTVDVKYVWEALTWSSQVTWSSAKLPHIILRRCFCGYRGNSKFLILLMD